MVQHSSFNSRLLHHHPEWDGECVVLADLRAKCWEQFRSGTLDFGGYHGRATDYEYRLTEIEEVSDVRVFKDKKTGIFLLMNTKNKIEIYD